MVKRPTWILLAILALVIGSYFMIKSRPSNGNIITPTPTGNIFLFTGSDGALQSLHIFDKKSKNFQMQRDLSKTWVITVPQFGVADKGLAGAAETQVGSLRILTMLDGSFKLSDMGLDVPTYTLELGFVSGIEHKLDVGNKTPTGSGYYILYDGEKVYVIEQSGIESLLNLLTAPPYLSTETPFPISESTSTLTLGAAASPTP
jgi:hypothetical protein